MSLPSPAMSGQLAAWDRAKEVGDRIGMMYMASWFDPNAAISVMGKMERITQGRREASPITRPIRLPKNV